jgi:hypothetical protein
MDFGINPFRNQRCAQSHAENLFIWLRKRQSSSCAAGHGAELQEKPEKSKDNDQNSQASIIMLQN